MSDSPTPATGPAIPEAPQGAPERRLRGLVRRAASRCYELGGVVFVSLVLLLAAGECDDDPPTEDQPTEDQPTEDQPTEDQPTEDQPTEDQPTEAQPTEAQPTEAQPATTPAPQACDPACWAVLAALNNGYQQDVENGDDRTFDEWMGDLQEHTENTNPDTTGTDTDTDGLESLEDEPVDRQQMLEIVQNLNNNNNNNDDPIGCESGGWACGHAQNGINDGYLPPDFTTDTETDADELREIIKEFGEHNPNFNTEAALAQLPTYEDPIRGELINAIAAGLNLPTNPDGTVDQEMADQLGDFEILLGHVDSTVNELTEEDVDAGGPLINGQTAALLDRVDEFLKNQIVYPPPPPTGTYTPPVIVVVYQPPPPGTTICAAGYSVIAAQVTSTDNGCRPTHCDFGRISGGWCQPPTTANRPVIYVSGPDIDEDDRSASFTVELSHAVAQTVTVRVSTADGTAASGSDYTAVTNRLVTFPANRTQATVSVAVFDDTVDEPDETFSLEMSSPSSNADLSVLSDAEITIRDNDNTPSRSSSAATNTRFSCTSNGGVFTLNASWDPPPAGASGYQVQMSSNRAAWDPVGELYFGVVTVTSTTATAPAAGTYYAVIRPYGIPGVGNGTQTQLSATCTAKLPVYVAPPASPGCPAGWHEHGFDCHPDHTVPIVCGTSAHAYQVHDINDPSGHQALTHPACLSAPDVCSTGFHDHAGSCVRTHEDPPLPCRANRRLVWQNTIHGTSEVLACPDPAVDGALLVNTAGNSIMLTFSVDVTSGHVEPTRTFTITAVDGTAVNGTHYTMTTPVTATFDSATQTYTVSIPTIARQDHGVYPREFTVAVVDAHPLRGHVSVTATATINPPAIERQ